MELIHVYALVVAREPVATLRCSTSIARARRALINAFTKLMNLEIAAVSRSGKGFAGKYVAIEMMIDHLGRIVEAIAMPYYTLIRWVQEGRPELSEFDGMHIHIRGDALASSKWSKYLYMAPAIDRLMKALEGAEYLECNAITVKGIKRAPCIYATTPQNLRRVIEAMI